MNYKALYQLITPRLYLTTQLFLAGCLRFRYQLKENSKFWTLFILLLCTVLVLYWMSQNDIITSSTKHTLYHSVLRLLSGLCSSQQTWTQMKIRVDMERITGIISWTNLCPLLNELWCTRHYTSPPGPVTHH